METTQAVSQTGMAGAMQQTDGGQNASAPLGTQSAQNAESGQEAQAAQAATQAAQAAQAAATQAAQAAQAAATQAAQAAQAAATQASQAAQAAEKQAAAQAAQAVQSVDAAAQQAATNSAAMAPPAQAPAPLYPQYVNQQPETLLQPVLPQSTPTTAAVNAGVMGMIVVGTGAMGANLHKVQGGEMNFGEALGNSLAKGAAGGAGAAGAAYASTALTDGGLTGLAVTLGVATGIGYLLSGK